MQFQIRFTMSGIESVITNHFKMFFRDMLSEHRDKAKYRNSFGNQLFIFMTVVMKSNKVAIVRINTRSCDDRAAKIATDIFNDFGWFTFIRKCTDIETIFMIGVDRGFHFFKGVSKSGVKFT